MWETLSLSSGIWPGAATRGLLAQALGKMGPMDGDLVEALLAMAPKELGERIKAARLAAGLTQPDLAQGDVTVAYLSRIERGDRRPRAALIDLFASRLGVTAEHLIRGEHHDRLRALELELDLAELELAGGHADAAFARLGDIADSALIDRLDGGRVRAAFLRAEALDAMGDPGATDAYVALAADPEAGAFAVKAATALSRIWREAGDFGQAVTNAQRGLEVAASQGLSESEESIRLSVTLAAAHFERGEIEEAGRVCEAAIEAAERLESPVARAAAYWNTSVIEAEAGRVSQALHLAKKALSLLEAAGGVRDLARLRTQLGAILLRTDPPEVEEAEEHLQKASIELEWSSASPADRARNALVTARALHLRGDIDAARPHAERAIELLQDDLPLVRVAGLALLGQMAWERNDPEGARRRFTAAITILTGVGSDREAAQLWFELGSLADGAGMVEEARDAYRRAAASSGLAVLTHVTPAADSVLGR